MLLFRRPRALSTARFEIEIILLTCSCSTTLSVRLYSAGLLSLEIRNKILSRGVLVDSEKVSVLLVAIETTISLAGDS